MTKLSVNVNKIALLRNARDIGVPDVARLARLCVDAGSEGITVHPRPDQRHIRPADVREIAEGLPVEFNIEGNPFAEPDGDYAGYMAIVRETVPTQCTLVPDAVGQQTSDHGWDLIADGDRVKPLVAEMRDLGCRVSLFMDPDERQIERAKDVGADRIELYTEPYARAHEAGRADASLAEYAHAARVAQDCGLGVNAGHDLNLDNLAAFLSNVPNVLEVSIGHALISDALELGLAGAVRAYLETIASART